MIKERLKEWHFQDRLEIGDDEWGLLKVFRSKTLAMETAKLWIKTHPKCKFRILEVTTTKKEMEIK